MSYKSKAIRFIKDEGNNVKWCFLGSSLTFTAFAPKEFGHESINLAGESFNAEICSKLFEHYSSDLPELKIAVAEVSTVSLFVDTIERRCKQNQLESIFDWGFSTREIGPPLHRVLKVYLGEILIPMMREPVHVLLFPSSNSKRLSKKYRSYLYTEPGFVALKPREDEDLFTVIDKDGWQTGTANWDAKERFANKQISALKAIQKRCTKSKAQFAIVLPPLHSATRTTEVYTAYREVVSQFISSGGIDKSRVCDCSNLVSDERFRDAAHMDILGAKKYSKYVHQYFNDVVNK